ncbi:HsdR family type I site-specific deoxyribonuclease [Candidatus Woesearchaeota archaeon]|nr:HsdR family type I site-specific deoxyribonuclease [Candidatus Woesearchaeota archaeon]
MNIGQIERKTQNRIVKLFTDMKYKYLGNWEERENSNIEVELLEKYLKKAEYSDTLIKKAINELKKAIIFQNKSLYDANKEVYSLLRYGAKVKDNIGDKKQTVYLINWKHPLKNDFYIAEEVTVKGQHNKRPDVVLYVNGIAVGVLELKRSIVSISEGIRQNLDNQKEIFIRGFFSTIQLVMAGNDSEGLKYATIETPEKYYLTWQEESDIKKKLDRHLTQVCSRERLIEIIHDFIVFDSGIKKICRHNQYFGVKAAQRHVKKKEGGIIWHTQGSGKSMIMVWLAKWIKENIDESRVLIITDREELDGQIEKVFFGVEEEIYRTKSGKDLIKQLNNAAPWLICSLIHKFKNNTETDYEKYMEELKSSLPDNFKAKGNIFVFVDECHRTQSGKLHDAMEEILPNAISIGYTGTPLLKKDKKRSIEIFGRYIHTYKYDEAVADKVVLDLQYEAREIDQKLSSQDKVDQWFEAKTRGLTDFAKAELKKKWGTMQKVLSSQSRLKVIVADIMLDMETKDRLQSGRGNALLIAGSIYEACKYYELFQKHGLKRCAIVTSYSGDVNSIKGETSDPEEETENLQKYEIYQQMLKHYEELYPDIKTKGFEEVIKEKFIKEPGQMKLLIVVNKLLTGFDAPPATYLYIDQSMQDHGLFQAICRVNRLDGEDKEYGFVIDYKDLFKSLNKAVTDYTSEAFDGFDKDDVLGLLKDRMNTGKENLDNALESVKALCEPVKPPKGSVEFIEYFCGNTDKPDDLKNNEQRRIVLYKLTSKLLRAYANLANEMSEAGYTKKEAEDIKKEVQYYENIRTEIKLASGDYIDLKAYEPAMRHLIDSYISAEDSKTISAFENLTLIDLIVSNGEDAFNSLPANIRKNKDAVAEVIENNVRRLIIEERPTNPKYFEKMSVLLDDLIRERKQKAIDYARYLKKIVELVKQVKSISSPVEYPKTIKSKAQKAFYDNFGNNENLAVKIHQNIINSKPDGWRGTYLKKKQVRLVIKEAMAEYGINESENVERALDLAVEQDEY